MNELCLKRIALGLPFWLLLFLIIPQAYGNGWEHAAIPFKTLVDALDYGAPEMRMRAAQSLGLRGQPEAVEPLLRRLAKPEKNHRVRSVIYAALGNLKDNRALPALSTCLINETREELRGDCIAAMGLIGDNSTLPPILTALESDPSLLVQSSAVDALGNFSELSAVNKLATLVAGSGNRMLRQRAIRALGRTGSAAAADPLLHTLKGAASDNERILIVDALTPLRSINAVAPLQALLNDSTDPLLRTRIVIALGAIEDGSTYPTLIAMLDDTLTAVRYFAVRSLGNLKRREAVIPISRLSLEISQHLNNHSVPELFADPVPVLAGLSLQVAALEAITDLNPPGGLPALLESARPRPLPRNSATALKVAEGFYRQRRAALYGLGYTNSREAARILSGESGIRDPDFRLRAVAARSLGVLGYPDAVTILIDCLDDPAAEVRWTSARVLGRLRNKSAVKPLVDRLSDPNGEVRRQAALSLGFLGDARAEEQLMRLMSEDKNENVRTAAAFSVRLLKNDR